MLFADVWLCRAIPLSDWSVAFQAIGFSHDALGFPGMWQTRIDAATLFVPSLLFVVLLFKACACMQPSMSCEQAVNDVHRIYCMVLQRARRLFRTQCSV
jgi:hypothetical protein